MNKCIFYSVKVMVVCSLILLFGAVGCNTSKRIAKGKKPDHKSSQFLTKRLDRTQFEFTWLTAKVNSKVKMKGKTYNFKSSIRVRHDSVIWVSMSPAFGIEAARVKLTRDSIKFINRLDKEFWLGTYADFNERMDGNIDFDMMEDFIVGNAVGFDFDGKYKASVDTAFSYLLTLKTPRKLRKAVDPKNVKKEEKKDGIESDTTLGLIIDERKLEKALESTPENELILMRYWLDPVTFVLEKVMINDMGNSGVLELNFDDFRELDSQTFPYKTRLYLTDMKDEIEVNLKYSKVRINKPTTFPFKITAKYEQIIY